MMRIREGLDLYFDKIKEECLRHNSLKAEIIFYEAIEKANKEVFDNIWRFNDSLPKRLYNSVRYREMRQRHLSAFAKSDIKGD